MSQAGLSIKEILEVTEGKLVCKKGFSPFFIPSRKISTDSRNIEKGDFFIALQGRRFNGHRFIEEVSRKGACGAIISQTAPLPSPHFFFIEVKDTLFALQEIARYYRKKLSLSCVGITGSNGKTTVKEMVWRIVSSKHSSLKSEGNFNNQIGVPLTLLKLSPCHKWAILEMGMNSRGEIARLAEIIEPNIGVITNIHRSHIGPLGSLAEIKEAKAELIPWLNKNEANWLVLNRDDYWTPELQRRARCKVITFAIENQADVEAHSIVSGKGRISFTLIYRKNKIPVSIAIPGLYNIYNALAASAVSLVLGISLPDIARSLASFKLPPMHSQLYVFDDCQLIDDSYNANPESMKEALKLLQERGGQRKIAILGDMLELGNEAELYHYQLGKQAGESGVDALFVLGEFSKEVSRGAREAGTKNTFFFQDREKLKNELFSYLKRGDSLLVKGSRGMKMEEIVEDLKERLCCIS